MSYIPEGLLVAEEDLAEVAHAADEDAEVHVQLVELPGEAHPATKEQLANERERERESNLCSQRNNERRKTRDAEFIPDADMPFVADATGVPRLHLQC